jgi:hypothetical protein
MPTFKLPDGSEAQYNDPPVLPQEWYQAVKQLHPITAIIFWEVLNMSLTPMSVPLARLSPDWDRYTLLRVVGGGNPTLPKEVAEIAMDYIDEIFEDCLPKHHSSRILH